jgi:hypothetical protein
VNYFMYAGSLNSSGVATVPAILLNESRNTEGAPVAVYQWASLGLPPNDIGLPVMLAGWPSRSVQAEGTFGVNGALSIEGSNNGQNWHPISFYIPQGSLLAFTAPDIRQIVELTRFVRCRVISGDFSTNLIVTMAVKTSHL